MSALLPDTKGRRKKFERLGRGMLGSRCTGTSGFRVAVLFMSPALDAVSGVSTHAKQVLGSGLKREFAFTHFPVGSQGRDEGALGAVWRLLTDYLKFLRVLLVLRPRIIHLNPSLELKALARDSVFLAMARFFRIKTVFQVHGGASLDVFFSGKWIKQAILRSLFRTPDVVLVLSPDEERTYRASIPDLNVQVVPNAVNLELFDAAKSGRIRGAGPLRVLFLGRIIESKGILEVVDAVRLAHERGIECELRVAGEGVASEKARAAAAAAGLSRRVVFLGNVQGGSKLRELLHAQVFVLPTYFPEGLPYALLEAMAAETVPVVSPAGAIGDLVSDRVTGLLVPAQCAEKLADALIELHNDRSFAAKLASNAKLKVLDNYGISALERGLRRAYTGASSPE